jgi:hypothetical protein
MSIPHYQEASLQGENIAKRRVMQKAKKAFEGEEQRAIKSGQVLDELRNAYKAIVANLQLQIITMNITKSTIESIVASAFSASDLDGDQMNESTLHSLLIGTLGKLVTLSSQLDLLCRNLFDKIKESGRPVTGLADLAKINSLFSEVEVSYGVWEHSGLSKSLSEMVSAFEELGKGIPQVERLLTMYETSMKEAQTFILKLQKNEFETDIEKVLIPSKSKVMQRKADIASGKENREFTGEEYALLLELRKMGLLSGDDFTSVVSGEGDDSSISTRSSGSSKSSKIAFRPLGSSTGIRPPRTRTAQQIKLRGFSSSEESSGSDVPVGIFQGDDKSDSDDESSTLSSGSGLYSLPASSRFPMRIH